MRLVNGEWDAGDFMVIEPGHTTAPSYDDQVFKLA